MKEITEAICFGSKLTTDAVKSRNFTWAILYMEYCKTLRKVVKNNKSRNAVAALKKEVKELFAQIHKYVEEFLIIFEEINPLGKERGISVEQSQGLSQFCHFSNRSLNEKVSNRKGLKDHVDCTFDINEALAKVRTMKTKSEQELQSIFLNEVNIDRIAATLKNN